MKKLVLKKDVVARINNGEMNQLRGGGDYTTESRFDCPATAGDYSCMFSCDTCDSCNITCPHTCAPKSCEGTCAPAQTCPASCGCPQQMF